MPSAYNRAGVRLMPRKPIAVFAFALVISAVCLAQSAAQPQQSQTAGSKVDASQADLRSIVSGLSEDFDTLSNMASSLRGTEQSNVLALVNTVQLAMTETGGAIWLIEPYNKIVCDPDREMMKGLLQTGLKGYSHLLDIHIDALSHQLTFTRMPAVSQVVLRAQDRMRSAKHDM